MDDTMSQSGEGRGITGNGIEMNNPVIYIFLDELQDGIKNNYSSGIVDYFSTRLNNIDSIGIININEHDSNANSEEICSNIRTKLMEFQKNFMTKSYRYADYRRIYIICNLSKESESDSISGIEIVINEITDYFKSFRMTTLIDIFGYFSIYNDYDIKKTRDNITKNLDTIEKLYQNNKIHMVYLLSDINSKRIRTEPDITNSLILSSLIKDCTGDSHYKNNLKLYDERNFIENVNINMKSRNSGKCPFYTLGFKKMDAHFDGLVNAVVLSIINKCRETSAKSLGLNLNSFDLSKRMEFFRIEDIYSIMMSSNGFSHQNITKGDVLKSFFGDRADLFFDINAQKAGNIIEQMHSGLFTKLNKTFQSSLADINMGMYNIKSVLTDYIENVIKKEEEKVINALNEQNIALNNFSSGYIKNDNKEIGGLLGQKIRELPYEILYEYLEIKSQQFYLNKIKSLILKYRSLVEDYIKTINEKDSALNDFMKIIDRQIKNSIRNSQLISTNFYEYYEKKTVKYIEDNYKDFFEGLYQYFYSDNIIKLKEKLMDYADKIISSQGFMQDFHSEVYSRILFADNKSEYKTDKDVSELINKEIFEDRIYFLEILKSSSFFEEICYVSEENPIIFSSDNFENRDVCYFSDSNVNGFNVVYFVGGFYVDDINGLISD